MKRAVVMGASSGLGRETALRLARDGWQVGCAARRSERLAELQAQFPDRILTTVIDVTAEDAEERLLALADRLGGMDLYFHASGIGKQNIGLSPDIELSTVSTNGLGFTRLVVTAYRYMASHGGGHIAAISSIAGTKGLGAAPSYSATKAFQSTYLQALEQQARISGLPIQFTDIRPGFVDTELLAGDKHYPLMLKKEQVGDAIYSALRHHRHVRVIDWRWWLITMAWRCIPNSLWRRLRIH